jgi:serine/threonine-protein kinase
MGDELEIGQVLDNRYKVTALLNQGGMASIYDAIDNSTGQAVALKVPRMRYESDPNFFSRFQREEEIGVSLKHPSIIRILPTPPKSRPYLVMERLEGQMLSEILAQGRRYSVPDALQLTLRIAEAMEYLHAHKVIHRDLKPENIMMCKDGSLRVIDLGLAKGDGYRRVTFAGFQPGMGTPEYMSPEQVKGKGGDERSDIYSLGTILYVLATGKVPFRDPNAFKVMNAKLVGDPVAPRRLNPEISPQVEEIILHAMARNPEDRYATMSRMKEELVSPEKVVLSGRSERLVEPDPVRIFWRQIRVVVWAVLFTVGVMVLLFVVSRSSARPKSDGSPRGESRP